MFWVDFKGVEKSYGVLPPNGIMRMNTYVTHPWVAKVRGTNTRLFINGSDVYQPQVSDQNKVLEITVEEEESEEEEITVEGPATKLGLKGASMSTTYSGSFPASNALNSNGARTAITSRGVG
jgi:hypothetical protein